MTTNSTNIADKELFTTANTIGLLRKELIETLGLEHAKIFLQRYGWNIGVTHAKEVEQRPLSLREKLDSASGYHLNSGQITDLISNRILELNPDDTVRFMHAKGVWINSYEVTEHTKYFGKSQTCICHTLAGYSSGYTSYLTKRKIYIVEVTCKARGDDECAFEMRMIENWDEATQAQFKKIHQSRMIDELNQTYEQLYEEKKLTEKVSSFHNNLTLGIAQGMRIEQILETIYDNLNVPVILQDLNFNTHHLIGITEEELNELTLDFASQMPQTRSGKILMQHLEPMHSIQVNCEKHIRLISPINVQNQIIGYISFIYRSTDHNFKDEMNFLQRAANSISLCYLNEKSSLEAIENMKAYFFEQLLQQQYTSKSNMIYRSYLLQIDLNEDFYIGNLRITKKGIPIKDSIMINKIIQSFTIYLEMHQIPIFITEFQEEVTFLFPKIDKTQEILRNILKHLHRTFKNHEFRIGLSRAIHDIDDIPEAKRQSITSLNVNKASDIIYFEDTSVMGSIINQTNSSIIIEIAQRELEPILSLKPNKKEEFLKTLYAFLNNYGNLQQTMLDLNLSMSGLVYRIQKLEELLQKDLRNSKHSFELMLLLNSLIILGEIEID
ncbi:polyketide synthase regulator [Pradoshia sp. D12]|uniref:XylR N-terminal domain-containing protein n=1 Tax=Bacillaceae TaxID=186817 RepID=UPI00112E1068|nr:MULTISPECIES: XylR N-terminal domain-containing protein [Bacillaceae]QFK71916.1 polyketide synthase regulator [Pradoshia sp. D12]TPF73710.1 polyketide synthase regulator [Bacillus sp. D12]